MAVLLLDLDDTLVDRQAAFTGWAHDFVASVGAPDSDVEWLVRADAEGYAPRELLADDVRRRYGLEQSTDSLVDDIFSGMLKHLTLGEDVKAALLGALDAGWVPVVVTNGRTERQEAKIRRTGLDAFLADWVISEAVGVAKPEPRIFELATRRVGGTLDGAWMVGDTAHADIVGAALAGIGSTWVSHGRVWPFCLWSQPTHVERTAATAIEALAEPRAIRWRDGVRGVG